MRGNGIGSFQCILIDDNHCRRGYDQFCAEGLMANFTASCIMVFTGITVYLVLYPSYNPKVYLAAKPAPTL